MGRKYLNLVERILGDFAERDRELRDLGHSIAAACHGGGYSEARASNPIPEPERVLMAKEADHRHQWLGRHVGMVRKGLETLNDQQRLFVDLCFWKDLKIWEIYDERCLGLSGRSLSRMREQIIATLVPILLPDV